MLTDTLLTQCNFWLVLGRQQPCY